MLLVVLTCGSYVGHPHPQESWLLTCRLQLKQRIRLVAMSAEDEWSGNCASLWKDAPLSVAAPLGCMDAGHEMTASSDEFRAECDPSQLGVSSMPATSECGPRDGNPPAGKQTTRNSSDDNVSTMAG